jgi:ribose transport system permease protein
MNRSIRPFLHAFGNISVVLVVVLVVFGLISPQFLEPRNLINILLQSSASSIVAIGVTFTLVTAGIDLSVGSTMFLAAAVAGKLVLAGVSLPVALIVVVLIGIAFGLINAVAIAWFGMQPFIVTLATLFIGRGLALLITETRAMNLPESLLGIGSAKVFGVPLPIIVLVLVISLAHLVLSQTTFGRQVYAAGSNMEAAKKAGIKTRRILAFCYIVCGVCAALGGIVSVAQLGAVSPTFGYQREFAAIAAAVLGGTSLFGGRGRIFPGTTFGAILIQTVDSGLVIVNANPYVYPLIMATIIFLTALVDSVRNTYLSSLRRRIIRMDVNRGS